MKNEKKFARSKDNKETTGVDDVSGDKKGSSLPSKNKRKAGDTDI